MRSCVFLPSIYRPSPLIPFLFRTLFIIIILINKMSRIYYAFEFWKYSVYVFMIFFSALTSVDDDLYGLSWNCFWSNCNQEFPARPELAQRHYFFLFHFLFISFFSPFFLPSLSFLLWIHIRFCYFCRWFNYIHIYEMFSFSCAFIAFIFAYIQFV